MGNERYGTRQSEREPLIRSDPINSNKTFLIVLIQSQQLQQNLDPIRPEQNPRWVLGLLRFVDFIVSQCLIVGEEEFLEMGCCVWLFGKKIFWKWVCVCFFDVLHCFCFCWVSTAISIWQKTSMMDSSLAFQNQVYYIQDVSFLNSFENILINKIVWKSILKKIKINKNKNKNKMTYFNLRISFIDQYKFGFMTFQLLVFGVMS